jgi:DNA-binding response OmpR family regulator
MKKVLIIEDNADAAEILAMLLECHGHSVRCAGSGRHGLALAHTFQPDVVITDLGLPDMRGVDVIRGLAQMLSGKTSAIIALSGSTDVDTRRHVQEAGVGHFFAKGEDLHALLALVNAPAG